MENMEAQGRVHGDDTEAGSWKMDGTLKWGGGGRGGEVEKDSRPREKKVPFFTYHNRA